MLWSANAAAFVGNYSASVFFVEIETPEREDPKTGEIIAAQISIGTAFNIGCH